MRKVYVTENLTEKVEKWLEEKGVNFSKCDACKENDFEISSELWGLLPFREQSKSDKLVVEPFVMLYCRTCANTKLFAANMIDRLLQTEFIS